MVNGLLLEFNIMRAVELASSLDNVPKQDTICAAENGPKLSPEVQIQALRVPIGMKRLQQLGSAIVTVNARVTCGRCFNVKHLQHLSGSLGSSGLSFQIW